MLNEIYEMVKNTDEFLNAVQVFSTHNFHVYSYDAELYTDEEYYLDRVLECWNYGLTKVVAIFDNYVLKTPIMGAVYQTEYGDWELCIPDDAIDFCSIEVQIYERAKKVGLDYFFAETIEIDDKIYMQEKIDKTFYVEGECSVNYKARYIDPEHFYETDEDGDCIGLDNLLIRTFVKVNGLGFLYDAMSDELMVAYLAMYSLNELKKLNDFLYEYDICDLHETNVGWLDGELKFIDFSGVCESTLNRLRKVG